MDGHKRFRVKAVSEDGSGTAVFATFNVVDLDRDLTVPAAFGTQDVPLVPAHDWGHVPIGKGKTRETATEALIDFQLNLDVPAAKDWHEALKFDLANEPPLQEWSYGYEIVDAEYETREGEEIRVLKRIKVFEVSPVLKGAGINTRTLDVKGQAGNGEDPADGTALFVAHQETLARIAGHIGR